MSRTLDRSQGKFEAMPVSDGAPIVESGSNADGEWTKFSSGILICVHRRVVTTNPGNLHMVFSYPPCIFKWS